MKKTLSTVLSVFLVMVLFVGIGVSAFAAGGTQTGTCGNNVNYTLKDGVLTISGTGEINSNAFNGNWEIKKLIIEEGVTGIGQRAFENCGAMTSATLADSTRLIASYAFSRCNALREIVMGNNDKLALQDYAIDHCENVHITFKGAIKYPFQSRAFYYSNVTATVPDSWTENEMKDYFASSVNYIGGWAKKGDLQVSQRELGVWEIRGNGAIGDGAFRDRTDVKKIIIDSGVSAIGANAFANCTELTSVTVPSTVTKIGNSAFENCAKLNAFSGADSVSEIGTRAFAKCSALKSFAFSDKLTQMGEEAFMHCSALTKAVLPGTLTKIEKNAFYGCKALKEVVIGEGTEAIGDFAFQLCPITTLTMGDSVKTIGTATFYGCPFSTLKFPANLESIGDDAFRECANLKKAEFGDKLRTVGKEAFELCKSLETVRFSEGLEKLGMYCFQNAGVKSVELPDTLKEIGGYCFYGLKDMTSIVIPASVTKMGPLVFKNATNLKEITCLAEVPPVADARMFEGSSVKKVNVPAMSAMAYMKAQGWSGVEFIGVWEEDETLTPNSKGNYVLKTDKDVAMFLYAIANGNSFSGKTIVLDSDIDMSDVLHSAVWTDAQRKSTFMGHFDGKGHTISNLAIKSDDHRNGLFRTVGGGAIIENLVLSNVNVRADDMDACGALIGYVNGTVTVNNVTVKSGSISGGNHVGGLIGEVTGSKLLTVTSCVNNASVSATGKDAGGIVAYSTTSAGVKLDKCENTGAITSKAGHAGGIAGYLGNNSDDPAHTVQNCKNSGAVITEGNGGGIVGGVRSDSTDHIIFGNENTANVKATGSASYAGGIIGYLEGGGLVGSNKNSGDIVSAGREAGGIVAAVEDDSTEFDSDENSGSVKAKLRAGGIVGYAGDKDHDKAFQFTNCTNSGAVISETSDAGGIVGGLSSDNRNHTVCGNKNSGDITGVKSVGGIIGWMAGGGKVSDNVNTGNITATGSDSYAGGIVGHIEDDPCTFDNCKSKGTVSGSKSASICGWDGYNKKSIGDSDLTASVFSGGSLIVIICCVCLLAAVGAVVLVRRKRKSTEPEEEISEEISEEIEESADETVISADAETVEETVIGADDETVVETRNNE